jgi:ketosteroid isomerase-like protein
MDGGHALADTATHQGDSATSFERGSADPREPTPSPFPIQWSADRPVRPALRRERVADPDARHGHPPGARIVTARKAVVESYFEGFRQGDHARVLVCLTDDVIWDLPGHGRREGKDEFDREIENEQFTGHPTLVIDRLVEEGDTVVAIGTGAGTHVSGATHRFAYCTVFTFGGDLVRRVESYIVPLPVEA